MRIIRKNKISLIPITIFSLGLLIFVGVGVRSGICAEAKLSRKQALGKRIFEDVSLSVPAGQSCGSCHSPDHFFTDPDANASTSEGAISGRFGARNTPTILYGSAAPTLHWSAVDGTWVGGQFWDGRVNSQAEQALKPLMNPLEMNNASPEEVIRKIEIGSYADAFRKVYGQKIFDDADKAFLKLGDAIQSYETSSVFSPFASKYDRYLQGIGKLSAQESRGLAVFESENKGNCAACHVSRPSAQGRKRPLFTDFSYDNLGVPKNIGNQFFQQDMAFNPEGYSFIDRGLGLVVRNSVREPQSEGLYQEGKFKVPTLRNIEKTGPYMHNGYFKTLRAVVLFYNFRDVWPRCEDAWTPEEKALELKCWPAPEVPLNVNRNELGHLGLTLGEIDDLLAFLKTLTDERQPETSVR